MPRIKYLKEHNGIKYFTVIVNGIVVKDCKLMKGKNGYFVSGPSRSYKDKQGETKWVNQVQFSADLNDKIVDAVDNYQDSDETIDEVPF